MGFLRTVAVASTTTAVTAAALAINSLSPSSSSSSNYNFTKPFLNSSSSTGNRFGLTKSLIKPPSALHMDALFVMVNGEEQDPENQNTHTKIETRKQQRRISNNR